MEGKGTDRYSTVWDVDGWDGVEELGMEGLIG